MLSKEDLQLLSDLMDKKLTPINERLDKMDVRLDQMQDDISELKEDVKFERSMINTLSEWAEAATRYYMRDIHYPLNEDEKVR